MTLREAALQYADLGWKIFPLKPKDKTPAFSGWQKAATTDKDKISHWWKLNPEYNIGLLTGEIIVIDEDVDREKGKDGPARVARWETESGHTLPKDTITARTGRGGLHLFYKATPAEGEINKNVTNLFKDYSGVDVRGKAGYVVLPPSIHPNGTPYKWENRPGLYSALPVDDSVHALLSVNESVQKDKFQLPETIPEGQRNDCMFRLASFLQAKGLSDEAILAAVQSENETRCSPPLEEAELRTIVSSAQRYQKGTNSYTAPFTDQAEAREGFKKITGGVDAWTPIPASDITYTPPAWIVEPYFLRGKLNLIQGNSGVGKTAFTMYLAACVSAGKPFCGIPLNAPGNVLILSAEDDQGVLKGRLEANGADVDRCFFPPEDVTPKLHFNAPSIERTIEQFKIDLVIFDPMQTFLGAKVDMYRANETRPILAELAAMASKQNCAIVMISHIGKVTKDKAAVNRSLGSVDIIAATRTALHVMRDPGNKEHILALPVKNNASKWGRAIRYTIEDPGAVSFQRFEDITVEELETARRRDDTKCPYEKEPMVITLRHLVQQHPAGGQFSYDQVREIGRQALGGVPLCTDNKDVSKIIRRLSSEISRNDGLEIETGVSLGGKCRGIKITVHRNQGVGN